MAAVVGCKPRTPTRGSSWVVSTVFRLGRAVFGPATACSPIGTLDLISIESEHSALGQSSQALLRDSVEREPRVILADFERIHVRLDLDAIGSAGRPLAVT